MGKEVCVKSYFYAIKGAVFDVARTLLVFAILAIFSATATAEVITDSNFDYTLDIPEGFVVSSHTQDGLSYLFHHKRFNVSLVLKIHQKGSVENPGKSAATAALRLALDKLFAQYTIDTFDYYGVSSAIAQGQTNFGANGYEREVYTNKDTVKLWAEATTLAEGATVVLICYTPLENFSLAEQVIVSTLNSLHPNPCDKKPKMGFFTYYAFPRTKNIPVTLTVGGKTIKTQLDSDDKKAAKFLIDCEYKVLTMYAGDGAWQEAWVRYYRAIYRDSLARLEMVARDVGCALMPSMKKANKGEPLRALNEVLLSWVQSFKYARSNEEKTNSDFTPLPDALLGEGNDCDSRSMLCAVLINALGGNAAMFVSREYHHALYGVEFKEVTGAAIKVSGENGAWYLLCETTGNAVAPGLVSKDMTDTLKWIPITFEVK